MKQKKYDLLWVYMFEQSYKFDRSQWFVAFKDMPSTNYRFMFINVCGHEFYTCLLEDWIKNEQPNFTC